MDQIKIKYPCFVEDFFDMSEMYFTQSEDDQNESINNITMNESKVFSYTCCPVSGNDSK